MTTFTVSSGQTSSGIALSAGDTVMVLSGGTSTAITIFNGGVEVVSAGAVETGATVNSGGDQIVYGSASSSVVLSGGRLELEAGGAVTTPIFSPGALYIIDSGALLTKFEVSGGVTLTLLGGTASAIKDDAGAVEQVFSGGTAQGTVLNGGELDIYAAGTANATTVLSGGSVKNLGTLSGVSVNSGGSSIVSSGGIVFSAGINGGGSEIVLSGGTDHSATVASGGTLTVSNGGSAVATRVLSGGLEIVSSGGTEIGPTISSSGSLLVLGGGTLQTLGLGIPGGTVLSPDATVEIGAGGQLSGFVVGSGGTLVVLAGGTATSTTVEAGGNEIVSSGGVTANPITAAGSLTLLSGGIVTGSITLVGSGARLSVGGTALPNTISGFAPGDTVDLTGIPFDPAGSVSLTAGNVLQIGDGGSTFSLNLDPNQSLANALFSLGPDGTTGTLVSEVIIPPPVQSPAALGNFSWAQGWGSPDNPRITADADGNGTTDYVGFGAQSVFIAYGGTFSGSQGTGPGFSPAVAAVQDFGAAEGYTASVQRGVAATGVGVGDSIYGQGFAGVYWYATTGETPQTDAAGKPYDTLTYQSTPNLYGNFGSQQGWAPSNGFQIVKTAPTDSAASILGFGAAGIVVGPQAFAPGAAAAASYVIPFAAGNNSGWDQQVDIRTFQAGNGSTLDLNRDGIADFVGMGPQGLAFAYGNTNGGTFGLGALQTAQIGGSSADLGDAQGWSNATTQRDIVTDPQTGFDDVLAFGAAGVYVAMGQDANTHNGQPFGQLYLAMPDFGSNQGWSVSQTPRIVGDMNGGGIPDIIGFGASSTFVAIGSRDLDGNLRFAVAPNQTITDFGYTQSWSGTDPETVRTLGDVAGTGHNNLILSGAFNTQLWQFG